MVLPPIFSFVRGLATALGYAVLGSILVTILIPGVPFSDVFLSAAGIAIVIWVAIWVFTDRDAAAPSHDALSGDLRDDGSETSRSPRGAATRAVDLAAQLHSAVEQLQNHVREREKAVLQAEAALEDVAQRRKQLEQRTRTAAEATDKLEQYIARVLQGHERRKLRREVLLTVAGAILGYAFNEAAPLIKAIWLTFAS